MLITYNIAEEKCAELDRALEDLFEDGYSDRSYNDAERLLRELQLILENLK